MDLTALDDTAKEIGDLCDSVIKIFPSRLQMFLYAFYVWSFVLFYLSRLANFTLGLIITYLPTLFIPKVSPAAPIKVLRAFDDRGRDITKRLCMFMKFKWDKQIGDDGGVDLDKFVEHIGSSIIWVAYIMEYEISDTMFHNFLSLINSIEQNTDTSSNATVSCDNIDHPIDYFKRCVKFVIINTSKKVIYKLKKGTKELEPEPILFGEIDFT